jgi:hypothetical protein
MNPMPEQVMRGYEAEHPAPHAHRVGRGLLFLGVLLAPTAWAIQLVVNYGLASYVCFPQETPRFSPLPGWEGLRSALVIINVVALIAAVAGIALSFRNWRLSGAEARGGHGKLLEAGEGRTRFLAVWGLWSGVWFLIAILFNTIALVGVPLCGQ